MSAAIAGPGTTPKPAASADQPQSSWRVSVLNRITAMNADEKKVWPTAADQKDLILNRERSSSGFGCVVDRLSSTARSINPTTTTPIVRPEP